MLRPYIFNKITSNFNRVSTNYMDIPSLYSKYIKGHCVCTDTRNISPGDVFIALRGENFNGNEFAHIAIEKGALLAIVDTSFDARVDTDACLSAAGVDATGENYITVPNTTLFLQEIARYHRQQLGIPIIGITGTNGKTTTKELCNAVLSTKYKTFATHGNLNNHIGVPLTLLSMNEETEIGIVEMGANHLGEIAELCNIAEPDYGVITNIGEAHIEGFGSSENIIATKKALYDYIKAKEKKRGEKSGKANTGKVFVCSDDELLMRLSAGMDRMTYGQNGDADVMGEITQKLPYLEYTFHNTNNPTTHQPIIRTHLTGGYNFGNAMAAACIGTFFGVPTEKIQQAIEAYKPSNMRSQIIKTETNTVILDAYNANPSSMKVALENFADFKDNTKIVVLGEMLELGKASPHYHEEIIRFISKYDFKQVFLVGKNFENMGSNLPHVHRFANTTEIISHFKQHPIKDSFIFVKGSRGNKLEDIVGFL
ncbi:UDP-N-acetylmuramoyl-tripeptide--D-alanyl-D-alanine ligase [Bacteroidia bacterium]|nr:UDP-N-acetylmuramoyl-tripeptide--D-alanyl-D-alanine ligase [Bacteroidia bacterium]